MCTHNRVNYGTYKDDHIFQGFYLGWEAALLYMLLLITGALVQYAY
jgi:hypothetical protein